MKRLNNAHREAEGRRKLRKVLCSEVKEVGEVDDLNGCRRCISFINAFGTEETRSGSALPER